MPVDQRTGKFIQKRGRRRPARLKSVVKPIQSEPAIPSSTSPLLDVDILVREIIDKLIPLMKVNIIQDNIVKYPEMDNTVIDVGGMDRPAPVKTNIVCNTTEEQIDKSFKKSTSKLRKYKK